MPPRIGHRKSKAGCRLCKMRKVKCDEQRPRCGWCQERDITCTYDVAHDISAHDPEPDSDALLSYVNTFCFDKLRETVHEDDKKLSMFLLHHFTSSVVTTFPTEQISTTRRLYGEELVQLAFMHDHLMSAVLCVSAQHLHLAATEERNLPGLPSAVVPPTVAGVNLDRFYSLQLDLAATGLRVSLTSVTSENALAVFYASVLLCIASMRPIWYRTEAFTATEPFVSWLTMSNAITAVSVAAIPKLFANSAIEFVALIDGIDYFRQTASLYNPAFTKSFSGLLEFADILTHETDEDIKYCQSALALIGGTYEAILSGEPATRVCRRLMAFGPLLPAPFISLVVLKRPRALSILAQFMALTRASEEAGYWWFYGVAERDINCLKDLLPYHWRWAIEWPVTVAQHGWNPEAWTCEPPSGYPPPSSRSVGDQ